MFILRSTIIGIFCICYASCQNDINDWIKQTLSTTHNNAKEETKGECRVFDGRYGSCVKMSRCSMPPIPLPPTTDRIKICKSTEVCCPEEFISKGPKSKGHKKPTPPPRPAICGVSNPGASVRMAEGDYADFAEFPWMVALLRSRKETRWSQEDLIGGGALIHRSVVITAAHNILPYYHRPQKIKCRAGEWDTTHQRELKPHQEVNVRKFVAHDDFVGYTKQYDVALVILSEPFDLTVNIDIACLGSALPAPGMQCFGMGWGKDAANQNEYAHKLKKIMLPFVSAEKCQENLRKTALGPTFELHPSLMCAGGEEGRDLCVGDGGSPLVCAIDSTGLDSLRYAVYGLASYGMSCGVKDVPGVYAAVPSFHAWVTEQMALENFSSSQYIYTE